MPALPMPDAKAAMVSFMPKPSEAASLRPTYHEKSAGREPALFGT